MSSLTKLAKAILYAVPYLLLLVAFGVAGGFLIEAAARLFLWIFMYHFQPWANHMDGVRELQATGSWALAAAAVPLAATWRTRRRVRTVSLCFFAFVAMTVALFTLMVATKGLVSYEEFVQHGV